MHRLILALVLALAACTGEPPANPVRAVVAFDAARFAGSWHEVAAVGRPAGGRWQVSLDPDGRLKVQSPDGAGRGEMRGPGRFALSTFEAPLWVLWADADMRSVLLGTPDRSFATLLDRAATIAPDRLIAAREILAWNGYDEGALR